MRTFPHYALLLVSLLGSGCGYGGTAVDALPPADTSDFEPDTHGSVLEAPPRQMRGTLWSDAVPGTQALSADFDGDAHSDLLVPGYGSEVATILPGAGDGRLAGRKLLHQDRLGAITGSVTPGDFDDDGVSELAYLSTRSTNDEPRFARLSTARLLDNGELQVQVTDFAGYAHALALLDFDRDGLLDALVGYAGSNLEPSTRYTLMRWRGNGDGTFELKDSRTFDGLTVLAMTAVDTSSGLRLALSGSDTDGMGALWLLKVDGEQMELRVQQPMPLIGGQLLATDLDGRSGQELVLVDRGRAELAVVGGAHAERVTDTLLVSDSYALAGPVVAVDVDGDQQLELAFAATNVRNSDGFRPGPAVVVLHKRHGLQFTPRAPLQLGDDPAEFGEAAVAADFDGDGQADLGVLTNSVLSHGRLGVLLARAGGVH